MLVFSNIFMTFAWYGHLKLSEMKISTGWPLILVILFSWGIAFFEYCLTVPANRIGFIGNGGPFNLLQLKVIQEVISLTVFTVIVMFLFKGQTIQWNHLAAFVCLVLAVFFVFLKYPDSARRSLLRLRRRGLLRSGSQTGELLLLVFALLSLTSSDNLRLG